MLTKNNNVAFKILITLIFMCGCTVSYSQEICTNGIDDDGDLLIDIQETECLCPNESVYVFENFENNTCCPDLPGTGTGNGIECLMGMSNASLATPDFFHTCGFMGGPPSNISLVPLPLPSGEGCGGFGSGSSHNEVIGNCLNSPLVPGEQYDFSFFLGWNNEGNGNYVFISPFPLSIYGTENCVHFPATTSQCIIEDPDWILLTTISVDLVAGGWSFASGNFIAPDYIGAIAFGGNCDSLMNIWPPPYTFIDDFTLQGPEIEKLEIDEEIIKNGDCISGITLSNSGLEGATYQWYLNSATILGATSLNYNLSPPFVEGEYTLMIIKDGLCALTDPYELIVDEEVLDINGITTNVSCFNAMDGSIDIDVNTTNEPLMISWNNGETTLNLNNLDGGTYEVTITDANYCYGLATFNIVSPELPLELNIVEIIQPTSSDTTGTVILEVLGGTPFYEVYWSNGLIGTEQNNLQPGSYFVVAIDANGCESILSIVIYSPLSMEVNVNNENCVNCSGSANVIITGGKPPYTYSWSNAQDSSIVVDLCAGDYSVTITDELGNQDSLNFTVPPYVLLSAQIIDSSLVNCTNQNTSFVILEATGGNPYYHYLWNTGDTTAVLDSLQSGTYQVTITDSKNCQLSKQFQVIQSSNIEIDTQILNSLCQSNSGSISINIINGQGPFQILWSNDSTGLTISNLSSENYSAYITDIQGCIDTFHFFVPNTQSAFTLQTLVQNSSCNEIADGSIELIINNTIEQPSILWSNGQSGNKINNLGVGSYSAALTDTAGCTTILNFEIKSNPTMEITQQIDSVSCFGENDGMISLELNYGNPPYKYKWSNGDTLNSIAQLAASSYLVTVTDSKLCTFEREFIIDEPEPIKISSNIIYPNCPDDTLGQIESIATGGNGGYTYKWNSGSEKNKLSNIKSGVYVVTVTDIHQCSKVDSFNVLPNSQIKILETITNAGCDNQAIGAINLNVAGGVGNYEYKWNTGQEEADIQSLGSGEYTVTITDDLMCTLVDTFQILSQGSLNAVATHEDILCYGETNGAIQINATSLNPPLTYNLNGNVISNNQISNLGPSTYEIKVIDAIGCEWTEEITIEENSELIASIDNVNHPPVGQQYGSATVSALGGTSPYTIMWDNGEATTTATQLLGGMHEVTVTDFHGCSRVLTLVIESSINVNFLAKENACFEECKGELTIVVVPDDAELRYEWSDGGQGKTRTDFCNGVYSCKVYKDQVLIAEVRDMIITSPPAINIVPMIIDASCIGRGDGGITLQVEGGTSAYAYSWGNASTQRSIANLKAGKYQVTITDAKQCSKIAEYEVGEPAGISIDVKSTDVFCEELGTIELKTLASEDVEVKVNSIAYTVAKEITITQLTKGRYNLEYILNSNCNIKMDDVVITETPFIIEGLEQLNIDVKKGSTVQYNLTNAKVQGDFDVRWKAANPVKCLQTDPLGPCLMLEITALQDDDMIIEIYNEEGCIEDYVIEIRVNEEVEVLIPNIFSPSNDEAFKPFSNQNVMIRSMMIYDRWGNVVYQESNKLIAELTGWNGLFNGKVAVDGVYVYHIEYEEEGGKQVVRMGDVTMVR